MNNPGSPRPPESDWTAQQVLAWMDSFRALVLQAQPLAIDGRPPYDTIRDADPMRTVRTGCPVPVPTLDHP